MIELTVIQHLSKHLSVPVGLEKPEPLIESYVLFEKIGSNKENHLNASTLAFQSIAKSLYEAALLNVEVKKAVESLIELNSVASVKLDSDYNFTDTTTKQYRYQAVYDIKHY